MFIFGVSGPEPAFAALAAPLLSCSIVLSEVNGNVTHLGAYLKLLTTSCRQSHSGDGEAAVRGSSALPGGAQQCVAPSSHLHIYRKVHHPQDKKHGVVFLAVLTYC